METPTGNPGSLPANSPAPDGAAVAAETADLLRRYLVGDDLTPKEFGLVGAHYKRAGVPQPKDERKAAQARKRVGTTVATQALLAADPPRPDSVAALAPPPAASADSLMLLERTARSLLGTGNRFLERKALRVADKLKADAATRREIEKAAQLAPEAVELITAPLPALAAKYGVPLENLPEASLACGVLQILGDWTGVFMKLDELEKLADERERRNQPKAEDKAPAP
jgi:hypothetical protein